MPFFVVLLVTFTLVLGVVVDGGRALIERQYLSHVADLAAVSGAQMLARDDLDETVRSQLAGQTAWDMLQSNRLFAPRADVADADAQVTVNLADQTVRIELQRTLRTSLAGLVGINTVSVANQARAVTGPLAGVRGAVPWAVIWDDSWSFGQQVVLYESGPGTTGNWGRLRLDPTSPGTPSYRNFLRNGFDGWLFAGEFVETETGYVGKATAEETQARIDRDPDATWDNFARGSPRLVFVLLISGFPAGTSDPIEIQGFAAFFLEEVDVGPGNKLNGIYGRFVRYVTEGVVGAAGQSRGVYAVRIDQ